jgi:hypothetical protein
VSAREGRTVPELLDNSDGLAREALQSAAQLWAVLPPDLTVSANSDPIAILAAMGSAVGRSLAAGHWRWRGPAMRLEAARPLGRSKPTGHSPTTRTRPI